MPCTLIRELFTKSEVLMARRFPVINHFDRTIKVNKGQIKPENPKQEVLSYYYY